MPAASPAPAARLTRSQRRAARRSADRPHHSTAERSASPFANTSGPGASTLLPGEGPRGRIARQGGDGGGCGPDATEGVRSAKPGPNTPSGRAAVSQNAVTHGLRSERPVLSSESQEEWDAHLECTLAHYAPRDPFERALAERIALCLWRLGRVTRYETDSTPGPMPTEQVATLVIRYEGHLNRQLTAAMRALAASQSRPLPSAPHHETTEQSPPGRAASSSDLPSPSHGEGLGGEVHQGRHSPASAFRL